VNQVEFLGLSTHFCDSITKQRSNILQTTHSKSMDTQIELNKFYCCKGSAT